MLCRCCFCAAVCFPEVASPHCWRRRHGGQWSGITARLQKWLWTQWPINKTFFCYVCIFNNFFSFFPWLSVTDSWGGCSASGWFIFLLFCAIIIQSVSLPCSLSLQGAEGTPPLLSLLVSGSCFSIGFLFFLFSICSCCSWLRFFILFVCLFILDSCCCFFSLFKWWNFSCVFHMGLRPSYFSLILPSSMYTTATLNFNADFAGKFRKELHQIFIYFFTAG